MAVEGKLSEISIRKTGNTTRVCYVYENTIVEHPNITISGVSLREAVRLIEVRDENRKRTNTKAVESREIEESALSSSLTRLPGILWKFLWELLADEWYETTIAWTGESSIFVIKKPELLASWWGKKKNNEKMNYAKLGRAIRGYYTSGIITKGPTKFTYKFDEDQVMRLLHH